MNRRELLLGSTATSLAAAPENVILILADDLGYGDLGCYGSNTGATPHLDRLAAAGARFTNHYTCSPVCSQARAGLMTGLAPDRTGVTGVLRDNHDDTGLSRDLPTIAAEFRKQGAGAALIGKWHLGMSKPYWPRRRGFDYFWGFLNGTIDYYTHRSLGGGARGSHTTYENERLIEIEGYFPELMTAKAVDYIERNRSRRYFLYLSAALPHTPLQAPERWVEPFRGAMPESQAVYCGMVRCLDDMVGQVRTALERTGQWDRTAVVFVSDHGWVKKRPPQEAGSNGALRGGKYELYEGGIRVPCILRWPGVTRPGSVVDAVSWLPDWFPTLTGVASRDGIDLRSVVSGGKEARLRELCWRFEDPLVKTPLSYAIRCGRWKLLRIGREQWLFDVEKDLPETRDLAAASKSVVEDLERRLADWRRSIQDFPRRLDAGRRGYGRGEP